MPGYDEIADIDVINGNMDKIDVQMKKNADSAQQSKDIVSDEYSATNTYAVGDYCIHENILYKCKTAITTGEAFDSNKWIQTTCGTEFIELNSNLDDLQYSDVAGGKNLFNPKCLLNATYDEKTNTITVSNNINKALDMVFKENTQYTFSAYIKQSNSSTNNRFNVTYTDGTSQNAFLITQSTSEIYISQTSESGKTISEVNWYYGSKGTATFRNFQIEEGTTATPYEPYIPSVKMLAEEVSAQNESLDVIGKCKNLLNPTLQTTTQNGVTFTNNGDGTYTLNGTNTQSAVLYIDIGEVEIPNKNLVILGSKNTNAGVYIKGTTATAYGNKITVVDSDKGVKRAFGLAIKQGATITNEIVKPMLCENLNATYDDFVPYTGDGDTLTHDVAELKNDLGGLSLSASGTTLTITDGTNTWTLEAN